LWSEVDPGQAAGLSCHSEVESFIREVGSCKFQDLCNVLFLKLWILAKEFLPIRIGGNCLQNPSNGQAHVSNARLPVHLVRVEGDAIIANYARDSLHTMMLSPLFSDGQWLRWGRTLLHYAKRKCPAVADTLPK
jgi:hypothetical protein